MVKRYAGIAFRCSRRIYCFEIGALHLKTGDDVVVETDRGVNMGVVVIPPEQASLPAGMSPESVKKVLRKARDEDFVKRQENAELEKEAMRICREKIARYKLNMKLVQAEYMHDGNRVIFYFTAENRVDFRELVKDLAHTLHVRVEMRQIGIRDAAGMIGGVGICGRELCCATFLTSFEPVTVKMAKEQNLALNPMKISGICGRLMCCLGYEYENYRNSEGSRRRPRRKSRGSSDRGGDSRSGRERGTPAAEESPAPASGEGEEPKEAENKPGENARKPGSGSRRNSSSGRRSRGGRGGKQREKKKKEPTS
jgi:cell fate regulator YaaT (PSP1 superfamily)